jgi:hypothetical protein
LAQIILGVRGCKSVQMKGNAPAHGDIIEKQSKYTGNLKKNNLL